jgi:cyclin C
MKFWTFTKPQLALERKRLEDSERNVVTMYPLPDRRHLSIYFYHRESHALPDSPTKLC